MRDAILIHFCVLNIYFTFINSYINGVINGWKRIAFKIMIIVDPRIKSELVVRYIS